MTKKTWTIARLNLKNIRVPYFVTCLVFLIIFVQTVVYTIVALSRSSAGHQLSISSGNYLWLLVIMAAIFIPAKNFRMIVNLGGKRNNFFWGSIVAYAVLACAVSIANTAFYYIFEHLLINTGYYVGYEAFMQNTALMDNHYVSVNLIELFGWSTRGIFFAFIQQFSFLFLLATVIHTLTAMQDKWYGWAVDLTIAAILAIFIPIASLRIWLISFLNLIIFNPNAFMQMAICLTLAIVVYMLSKPILARKTI